MSLPDPTQPVDDECSQFLSQCEIENVWGMLTLLTEKLCVKQCIGLKQTKFTFGRQNDCDFFFDEKCGLSRRILTNISRVHFVIERKEISDGLFYTAITDYSSNGTFINEEIIGNKETRILCHKDIISIMKPTHKLWMFNDLTNESFPKIPKEIRLNYIPLKIIGQGGYGDVFFVLNKNTIEKYAMKRISVKPDTIKRIDVFAEATILRSVTHQNIIRLHDMMLISDELFIFLEYMSGGDLNSLLRVKSRLSESVTKHIFFQVSLAIEYLHREKKIIHRDIKPANILISSMNDEYPSIKVTDFGLSKIMKHEVTRVRTLCGTANFKPPELVCLKYPGIYDTRVDVWSLGILLYLCLCGEFPFSKMKSTISLEKQILQAKFQFQPTEIWRKLSIFPKQIITKCLQKEYTKRMTSSEILVNPWFNEDINFQRRLGLSEENFSNYENIFKQNILSWKRSDNFDVTFNSNKKFKVY